MPGGPWNPGGNPGGGGGILLAVQSPQRRGRSQALLQPVPLQTA